MRGLLCGLRYNNKITLMKLVGWTKWCSLISMHRMVRMRGFLAEMQGFVRYMMILAHGVVDPGHTVCISCKDSYSHQSSKMATSPLWHNHWRLKNQDVFWCLDLIYLFLLGARDFWCLTSRGKLLLHVINCAVSIRWNQAVVTVFFWTQLADFLWLGIKQTK